MLPVFKDLLFAVKKNKAVRIFLYPYCTAKRNRQTNKYINSDFSRNISQWKDKYKGKRCFIIGNGPSLTAGDLELLKANGEITFASNRIYHIYDCTDWRPDFYVAFEREFCRTNADMISSIEVRSARFLNLVAWSRERESSSTFWLNCTSKYISEKLTKKNIEFSDDISVCVNDAYSVTYTMLQLAVYMGFGEIVLLGVDHYEKRNPDMPEHFYGNKRGEYRTPTYLEGIECGYVLADEEARKRGVNIYNATRGGQLEVFKRTDFDSMFGNRMKSEDKCQEIYI